MPFPYNRTGTVLLNKVPVSGLANPGVVLEVIVATGSTVRLESPPSPVVLFGPPGTVTAAPANPSTCSMSTSTGLDSQALPRGNRASGQ